MIKNKSYTGYLINGNVETHCPELQIIEPDLFERAQEVRQARKREKGTNPISYSSQALLCGIIFCAHCGKRMSLTSSTRKRIRADGTVIREKRIRYSCNYNVRHPGQCDGQSGYGVITGASATSRIRIIPEKANAISLTAKRAALHPANSQ